MLDEDLNACPVGVPGMLHIGGDNLAHGYLGKPGLTAERFVPNPFLEAEKEKRSRGAEEQPLPALRLYRTGDRARWLPDGNLEFLVRADLQVKIRGQRVELGEVETALRQHPGVKNAAAALRDGQLAAYIVWHADGGPADLRRHLQTHLPDYMLPASYTPLPALPLTPSGKIARNQLPDPQGADTQRGYTPPRNETEARLAGIFGEVLELDKVGIHHDFFALGGHSLNATQVISRIGRAFGVSLRLRVLFEKPTIAELAEAVEQAAPAQEGLEIKPRARDAYRARRPSGN